MCCIVAGVMRIRRNLKKRQDVYQQWVEYTDAKRQGLEVTVSAGSKPTNLLPHKGGLGVEMQSIRSAGGEDRIVSGVGRLDIRSDLRAAGQGADVEERPVSLSQMQFDALYGPGARVKRPSEASQQLRDLDRHTITDMEAGAGATNTPPHLLQQAKSTSVFGTFNPLVMGGASPDQVSKPTAKPLTAAMVGGQINQGALGGPSAHSSRRIQFVSASPEAPLPHGMGSPPQSPELIRALDSIQIEETVFEDEDDDDEDDQ